MVPDGQEDVASWCLATSERGPPRGGFTASAVRPQNPMDEDAQGRAYSPALVFASVHLIQPHHLLCWPHIPAGSWPTSTWGSSFHWTGQSR